MASWKSASSQSVAWSRQRGPLVRVDHDPSSSAGAAWGGGGRPGSRAPRRWAARSSGAGECCRSCRPWASASRLAGTRRWAEARRRCPTARRRPARSKPTRRRRRPPTVAPPSAGLPSSAARGGRAGPGVVGAPEASTPAGARRRRRPGRRRHRRGRGPGVAAESPRRGSGAGASRRRRAPGSGGHASAPPVRRCWTGSRRAASRRSLARCRGPAPGGLGPASAGAVGLRPASGGRRCPAPRPAPRPGRRAPRTVRRGRSTWRRGGGAVGRVPDAAPGQVSGGGVTTAGLGTVRGSTPGKRMPGRGPLGGSGTSPNRGASSGTRGETWPASRAAAASSAPMMRTPSAGLRGPRDAPSRSTPGPGRCPASSSRPRRVPSRPSAAWRSSLWSSTCPPFGALAPPDRPHPSGGWIRSGSRSVRLRATPAPCGPASGRSRPRTRG